MEEKVLTLADIVEQYKEERKVADLCDWLSNTNAGDVNIQGLSGSSDAFVASAVFKQTDYHHLFILPTKEEAAYFQNNLQSLLPQKDIYYLPDSFKRPQHFEEVNSTNVLMRTETINRLMMSSARTELIVSYPEALIEMVVKSEKLAEQSLRMTINEAFDLDFAIDLLVGFDFERVDFVHEPGQFSIRGGIVDVYSFGNEFPYRIELDDDIIVSIRTFDPNSQLSVKKISAVSIVPNSQTFFTAENKIPLFEALSKNTIVWFREMDLVIDTIEKAMEKARNFVKQVFQM
jgi:transcription-repair coupling factor (superfamily II helicase)